jgi:hypothetical protein
MKREFFSLVFFSLVGISLFSQAIVEPDEDVTVWGWSRDGKVAVTEKLDYGTAGWTVTRAFIFNTANNTVLWANESNTKDLYGTAYVRAYSVFINNFHRVCRQQYAIEIKKNYIHEGNLIRESFDDGKTYNRYYINIDVIPRNSAFELFYHNIESYSVNVVSGNGRRKTILTVGDNAGEQISLYGYSINPDKERVLIIIKSETFAMEGARFYEFASYNLKEDLR